MSARQLIVLVIAGIAAIGALLLIRGMGSRKPDSDATPAVIAGEQVLVAARDIGQGVALAPGDLAVAAFPPETVSAAFIRIGSQPSAQAEYVGAVTRRAFAQGEPITTSSVVQPEGRGFMAAQLPPGYRAVAVEIDSATAVGGYVQPNDRVDVIMTMQTEGSNRQVISNIVLQDIRVLAIGDRTQTQTTGEGPERIDAAYAVLEMTADEAQSLAFATEAGEISLALRGVQAETVGMDANRRPQTSGGGVRVHAFGTVAGGSR